MILPLSISALDYVAMTTEQYKVFSGIAIQIGSDIRDQSGFLAGSLEQAFHNLFCLDDDFVDLFIAWGIEIVQ